MEQIQRDAAKSIGFTRDTWNAQFSSSHVVTQKKERKKITLDNVHSATAYELRRELECRNKYDPKKDGDACYRNFLRIMVNMLENERLKKEEKEMKEKEKTRLEQMRLATLKRNQKKESRRVETKTSEKKEERSRIDSSAKSLEVIRPLHSKPGTERIPSLQMPRRF